MNAGFSVAREARPIVYPFASLCLLTLFTHTYVLGFPLLALTLILAWLFREPTPDVPSKPLAIVAPIQGRIDTIVTEHNSWLERPVQRIGIQTSIWDAMVLRSAVEGKVNKQQFQRGSKDCMLYWVTTDEDDDVLMAIQGRFLAFRLRSSLHAGERVGHGKRCGFIILGGRVDILVAENSRIQVEIGDKVHAGSSILGELVH